jgi:hypothetical protein
MPDQLSIQIPKIPSLEFDTAGIPDLSPQYYTVQDIMGRLKTDTTGTTLLSADELKTLGLSDIEQGWNYKAIYDPTNDSFNLNIVTPENWVINQAGEYYDPTGTLSSQTDFENYYNTLAQGQYIAQLQQQSGLTQQQWRDQMLSVLPDEQKTEAATASDYDLMARAMGYISQQFQDNQYDLNEEGNTPTNQFGAFDPLYIQNTVLPTVLASQIPPNIKEALSVIMPNVPMNNIMQFVQNNPGELLANIVSAGGATRTPEKDLVLKYLIPDITENQLTSLFTGETINNDEAQRRSTITQALLNPAMYATPAINENSTEKPIWTELELQEFWSLPNERDAIINWYKKYQGIEPGAQIEWYIRAKTGDASLVESGFWQKVVGSLEIGTIQLTQSVTGALKWMGFDITTPDYTQMAQNVSNWYSPGATGIGWQVVQSIPIMVATLPLFFVGAEAGTVAAGIMGVGKIGTWLLQTLGAIVLTRPANSLLAVGSEYDTLVTKYGADEAKSKGWDVFKSNMALSGWDFADMALALMPLPKGWVNIAKDSKLFRTAIVGGKSVVIGLSVAGQSAVQNIIQRSSLGEEVQWDEEMQAAMIVGGIMGVGMGFVGDIISRVYNGVGNKISPKLKQHMEELKTLAKEQGYNDSMAEMQALEQMALESQESMTAIQTEILNQKANATAEPIITNAKIKVEIDKASQALKSKQATDILSLIDSTKWTPVKYNDISTDTYVRIVGEQPAPDMLTSYFDMVKGRDAVESISKKLGFANTNKFRQAFNNVYGAKMKSDALNARLGIEQDKTTASRVKAKVNPNETSEQAWNTLASEANQKNYVEKLTEMIKSAKPVRQTTEAMKHSELVKRVAQANTILEEGMKNGEGYEAFVKSTAALKGVMPTADFEVDLARVGLTDEHIKALFRSIGQDKTLRYFQKLNTQIALSKLLQGRIPTESELVLLENFFNKSGSKTGSNLVNAILSKRPTSEKIKAAILDIISIPQTLLTIGDHSAVLRQAILTVGQPVEFSKAFVDSFKAFWSEGNAKKIISSLENGPYEDEAQLYHVYRTNYGKESISISGREERYASRFMDNIPILGWIKKTSERIYSVFLDSLRMNIWNYYCRQWEKTKKTANDYIWLARTVNHLTGRGDLPGFLKEAGPYLNAPFFAPKFFAARIEVPIDFLIATPAVRGIIARNLVAFVGMNIGILALAKLAGAEVETDARSSDFGKIQVGNTRIDFWGGYQSYARTIWQLVTSMRKTTSTEALETINRKDLLEEFLRGKASPVAGMIYDMLKGKRYQGETYVDSTAGNIAIQELTPLFVQDLINAISDLGTEGALIGGIPSFFGASVQTYSENWNTVIDQLGLPTYSEAPPYNVDNPLFTTADAYSKISQMIGDVTADSIRGKQGIPDRVISIAEARDIKKIISIIPNSSLSELNADPSKDEGFTYQTYYQMWQDRQKIVASGDLDKLKAFDADPITGKAYLGNMSQAEYVLLQQYNSLTSNDDKKAFLKDHPELTTNPRQEWLKSHPDENAKLAIWGQAKILTQEAYDKAMELIKTLDIPRSAVDFNLPPDNLVSVHFNYLAAVEQNGSASMEAQSILANNPDYATWAGLKIPDKNSAYYDLQIKFQDNFDWYNDGIPAKYANIVNETERSSAIAKERASYLNSNPDFKEAKLRLDASTLHNPTTFAPFPENQVDNYVAYYELPTKGFRRERFLIDNPDFANAMQDATGLTIPDASKVPNVKYDDLYDEWHGSFDYLEGIGTFGSQYYIADKTARDEARKKLMFGDDGKISAFGKVYLEREAWGKFIPDNFVKNYVEYYSILKQGRPDSWYKEYDGDYMAWYEDDWYLQQHLDFYQNVYLNSKYWDSPHQKKDFTKVPTPFVMGLWAIYSSLPPRSKSRKDFRAQYPDLDAWLDLIS